LFADSDVEKLNELVVKLPLMSLMPDINMGESDSVSTKR
jgi:hypothetical protein